MLFPTPQFVLLFLPIALIGFQLLGYAGRRAAMSWLALSSIAFYACWRLDFVPLLAGSIVFNYLCATAIARTKHRPALARAALVFGITGDLAVLTFYKYLFPGLAFLKSVGIVNHDWGSVLLPLGISFFTFTQIGYLIDLYQDQGEHKDPITYCVFVTFFPHLIAGPILHHREVMPQLSEDRRYGLRADDFNTGSAWFLLGLAKKLFIADQMAPIADAAFAHADQLGFVTSWAGVLAYSMQLYFDFSGYSDMAVGLARMFSIKFPLNFNSPYKARNIIDFWQRWHMTLTRYITMYVYNPITAWVMRRRAQAGKKTSRKALATPTGFASMIAMPMMVTMTLAGIWHGAGWQYVVFGALHGFYLTVNHMWRVFGPKLPETAPKWQRWMTATGAVVLTFVCVMVGQVFFRADSVSQAGLVLRSMSGLNGYGPSLSLSAMGALQHFGQLLASGPAAGFAFTSFVIVTLMIMVWVAPNTQQIIERFPTLRIPMEVRAVAYSVAFYFILFRSAKPQSFIYFQF